MASDKRQMPQGHGTGSKFTRGELKAEDWIEPLPEKATEAQKKFYADHVERWNRPQEQVKSGELAGSDYRVKVVHTDKAPVPLPVHEHEKHGK
jgi:hypothetical protein